MSFARKIKTWGLATLATVATPEQETAQESTQIDVLPMVEHQDSTSPIEANTDPKDPETLTTVATVATVAKGPTLKNEVVEVHNPRLRRQLEANGLTQEDALALAIKLHARRADFDDRKVCFECLHYNRNLCTNAKQAGLSMRSHLMQVPVGTADMLQRCGGFVAADFP
jgi:hypothetical protein